MTSGLHERVTARLEETNSEGGYEGSLVCTEQGLLIASAGESLDPESLAGLVSLFDDIRSRAEGHLGLSPVDEFTLYVQRRWRLVVRPIGNAESMTLMFLVVLAPPSASWRRNTSRLIRDLTADLAPLIGGTDVA